MQPQTTIVQANDEEAKMVEKMIAQLGGTDITTHTPGPCVLLLEHLEAARMEWLGAMRSEYLLSLQQAVERTGCIPSETTRAEIEDSLRRLIDKETKAQGTAGQ